MCWFYSHRIHEIVDGNFDLVQLSGPMTKYDQPTITHCTRSYCILNRLFVRTVDSISLLPYPGYKDLFVFLLRSIKPRGESISGSQHRNLGAYSFYQTSIATALVGGLLHQVTLCFEIQQFSIHPAEIFHREQRA